MSSGKIRAHRATLLRPRAIEIVVDTARRLRLVCEPLERGYGDTLGPLLRHALLNAIPGSAVVAARVRSDGEGAEMPDGWWVELCLNLSSLVLSASCRPGVIALDVPAGRKVTASWLAGLGLEVADPNHEVCTTDRPLTLELWTARGRGVRRADRHAATQLPDGVWLVDAHFGPVRRASYFVERARVGSRVDYDRLLLDVETNGALSPRRALATAARVISSHLPAFLNFDEGVTLEEPPEPEPPAPNRHLFTSIADLELSVRAHNCLQNAHIDRVGDLVQLSERQLLQTRNFGVKSLSEINQLLAERGLSLGMPLVDWPGKLATYLADRNARDED